jgi:hypothetical protein
MRKKKRTELLVASRFLLLVIVHFALLLHASEFAKYIYDEMNVYATNISSLTSSRFSLADVQPQTINSCHHSKPPTTRMSRS